MTEKPVETDGASPRTESGVNEGDATVTDTDTRSDEEDESRFVRENPVPCRHQ